MVPISVPDWTVDYGHGEVAVILPHCWGQDVAVEWEGPAIYRRSMSVPEEPCKLRFYGASYAAEVMIDGRSVLVHRGIWDAFEVDLTPYLGKDIAVEVVLTKNGGASHPVRRALSGFLPYVFQTFGGLYKPAEIVRAEARLGWSRRDSRFSCDGGRLSVDGKPFYPRGVLSWGWYPEIGCPNPPEETMRSEIRTLKACGFNLVKFCLWVPPHAYLDLLNEHRMFAWMELPLWNPEGDDATHELMALEIERIVDQYKHHDNIAFWTLGCELNESTPAEFRQKMVALIKEMTGSPLVKDNSGGSEMYGGDLREFGDFDDFHPYCDLPFYPGVLDSLQPGPRATRPILLGEFNDADVLRDLARVKAEMPYWSSSDPRLNAQGVRWLHDLPDILATNRFAEDPEANRLKRAIADSVHKASFIRRTVQEWVRARDAYSGYVVTGLRDTPISTSGILDDWDELRFPKEELLHWNGPSGLFRIPFRNPPWVAGGNRPGWSGPYNFFEGQVALGIGAHSEKQLDGLLVWDIVSVAWSGSDRPRGRVASGESDPAKVPPLSSMQIGTVIWDDAPPGGYLLRATYCGVTNSWPFWVVSKFDPSDFSGCNIEDPSGLLHPLIGGEGQVQIATRIPEQLEEKLESGARIVLLLRDEGTQRAPFWRESAYEFRDDAFWNRLGLAHRWERLLPISTDAVIAQSWLDALAAKGATVEVLMNRIDARTMLEDAVLARVVLGGGTMIVTTLRPYGGLGSSQPPFAQNPAGVWFLKRLVDELSA